MKKQMIAGLTCASLLLAGCSGGGNKEVNKEKVKFGEIMNKGKSVFYVVSGDKPTKDSEIRYIVETDNGKQKSYTIDKELTLGDLKNKDDKEVLEKAQEMDKQNFEDFKSFLKESATNKINEINNQSEEHTTDKEELKWNKKALDKLSNMDYEKPEFRKVKIGVIEDETGNNTQQERFYNGGNAIGYKPTQKYDEIVGAGGVSDGIEYIKDNNQTHIDYNTPAGLSDVYDKTYVFMTSGKTTLTTKAGKNTKQVEFDEPSSKYVETIDE